MPKRTLTSEARAFLRRCVREATPTEPMWLTDDEDPGPMLECRRAGLVTSDVYAVMPTEKGRAEEGVDDGE